MNTIELPARLVRAIRLAKRTISLADLATHLQRLPVEDRRTLARLLLEGPR